MSTTAPSASPSAPARPPWPDGPDGSARVVGIELEFGGIDAGEAAAALARALGPGASIERADPDEADPHRHSVQPPGESPWQGLFTVELDSRYAHPDTLAQLAPELAELAEIDTDDQHAFQRRAARLIGDVAGLVMPVEVVAPPIAWPDLAAIRPLARALADAGATGTAHSTFAGFGMHLNVAAAALDADHLLAILRAYLLSQDWLRREAGLDRVRLMQSYIDPLEVDYIRRVLDPAYAPDLAGLMDEHMRANPSRNMELDLLPLFADLDPDRVARHLPDEKISPRPALHWRLPDCRIDEPGWDPLADWTRWVAVERLAADRDDLARLARGYLARGPRHEIEARIARILDGFT